MATYSKCPRCDALLSFQDIIERPTRAPLIVCPGCDSLVEIRADGRVQAVTRERPHQPVRDG